MEKNKEEKNKLKPKISILIERKSVLEKTYETLKGGVCPTCNSKITQEQLQGNYVNDIKSLDDNINKMMSPGVRGCFYSHYRLWKKCVELNEPITIWEDDIVLSRSYHPIDWDDVLVLALGHQQKSPRYMHLLNDPTGNPRPEIYKQSSMPGCCGYAIKPHAAKKLLDIYDKTFLPADNAINVHHLKIEIHSHVMGIALVKKDGKKSLTRHGAWRE
jgi:glycosyl transferase family 25